MICGGGKLPPSIRDEFCKLAGGPRARIVVIPTATSNADKPDHLATLLADWKLSNVESVQLLHTRSRETANDPAFVQPLLQATGVWLTGGDQVFLTDAYLGTAVQEQLKAILARGGVVAGTSAGAAVMSGVMIAGGLNKADVSVGFDFIKGAVIDQHFLKRNRMERLIGVLSMHPNLVGLGIDEETALVVDVREHHLSVLGSSYVVACVPDSQRKSVRLQFLKSGDTTAMADLMQQSPVEKATVDLKVDEPAGLTVGSL
ncbi:cyanophycinase [Singulisphaera sp. Ch08]|uniref:Cyanophycinase n=1 Tax=Singulisphaera sp. Ch08 TaxID=3120278 RepID=A0AAU7CGY0_9BACT